MTKSVKSSSNYLLNNFVTKIFVSLFVNKRFQNLSFKQTQKILLVYFQQKYKSTIHHLKTSYFSLRKKKFVNLEQY